MFKVFDKRDNNPVDMESLSQNQNNRKWWAYDLAWYRVHKLTWIIEEDGTLGLADSNGNVRYSDHNFYYPVFNNQAYVQALNDVLEIVEEIEEKYEKERRNAGTDYWRSNYDGRTSVCSILKTRIKQMDKSHFRKAIEKAEEVGSLRERCQIIFIIEDMLDACKNAVNVRTSAIVALEELRSIISKRTTVDDNSVLMGSNSSNSEPSKE